MSVEVVSKKKNGKVCGSCKHSLSDDEIAKSATTCPECGSTDIKKSLVVIRKAVGDEDDDLETGVVVDEDDAEEDDDDEEEDDDELSLEDEDDAVDEDDDDDEDYEEEDEEEDEPVLETASKSLRNHEVFNVMTACAEDIVKALDSGDSTAYEETMVEVNNVLDAAVEKWQKGHTITKSADAAGHAKLIRDRVFGIIGKEKGMPKTTKITKRDDLPEDVRKSLEAADAIVERDKVQHYDRLAKSFTHLGIDGPTLRKLEEDSPEAFATLKKSLETANGHIEKSEVLKSWGLPGGAEDGDSHHDQNQIAEIMKNEGLTREQAEVRLMDGSDYQPTVK